MLTPGASESQGNEDGEGALELVLGGVEEEEEEEAGASLVGCFTGLRSAPTCQNQYTHQNHC